MRETAAGAGPKTLLRWLTETGLAASWVWAPAAVLNTVKQQNKIQRDQEELLKKSDNYLTDNIVEELLDFKQEYLN